MKIKFIGDCEPALVDRDSVCHEISLKKLEDFERVFNTSIPDSLSNKIDSVQSEFEIIDDELKVSSTYTLNQPLNDSEMAELKDFTSEEWIVKTLNDFWLNPFKVTESYEYYINVTNKSDIRNG